MTAQPRSKPAASSCRSRRWSARSSPACSAEQVGRAGAHSSTILGVLISFVVSACVLDDVARTARASTARSTPGSVGGGRRLKIEIGFLIDRLTAMMMVRGDLRVADGARLHHRLHGRRPGLPALLRYISLFTFSMLMLVMSNNFLQLFFGWEAVGLVSYLLIGFWYTRPTAIFANLKAFLVNRVGDFGFLLGIGLIVAYCRHARLRRGVRQGGKLAKLGFPGIDWMLITVICICLFIGAMGKSAQFPLHVWLPDSMEGPTPISALIHAATMVTAGIFMVARMSPLFELSRHGAVVRAGDRRDHRALHGLPRHHPERHQARGRLLDAVAARLHDGGARRLGLLGGDVPPDDARLLQGAAVPRRRLGDHRHAPRAGHAQHGRPAQVHADHLDHVADRLAGADRHAVLRRLLLQGHDHRGGAREPPVRAPASPTSRCWPACSSPRSTRSACSSWPSTARSASATSRRARWRTTAHGARRPRMPTRTTSRAHGHDQHGTPHESPGW